MSFKTIVARKGPSISSRHGRKPKVKSSTIFIAAVATVAVLAVLAWLSPFLYPDAESESSSIELGDAAAFAVLAGTGITNTGATTGSGSAGSDFGSHPTPAFTGFGTVDTVGTKHLLALDPVTTAAKVALDSAYADAVGRAETELITGDLGGKILTDGVYKSLGAVTIAGTLTLDGQNNPDSVFIFQAASTLVTAVSSQIVLVNGAQSCNVFWQVGSSATIGVNSIFAGHVLAFTSITTSAGAAINGSLLAKSGAVTLDTNTFVNDACAPPKNVSFDSQGGSTVTSQEAVTVATAPTTTKDGLPFQGWFDAPVGGNQIVFPYSPTSDTTLYAQWKPSYFITFDSQGGSSIEPQRLSTLRVAPETTRDGFEFQGWFDSATGGAQIEVPFGLEADTTVYAQWLESFALTFDTQAGSTVASQTVAAIAAAPTSSRVDFVFQGWFDAATAGNEIAFPYAPTSDITLYAHWIHGALSGIPPEGLPVPTILTVDGVSPNSYVGEKSTVEVPAGALPVGTEISVYSLDSKTFVESEISSSFDFLATLIVTWVAPDGSVPVASSPVTVTITDPAIVPGARVYKIMDQVVTQIATATQAGTAVISFTEDPLLTIAITSPDAPTAVATENLTDTSVSVSWLAPAVDGGSRITGYTVTSSSGQTCTTATLSCQVSGLSEKTSYTFSVAATNDKGSSAKSSASSPVTTNATPTPTAPPAYTPPPVATETPVETAAPVETTPPVETTAPVETTPPVETTAPTETIDGGQLPNTDGNELSIWFGISAALLAIGLGSLLWRRRRG